MTAQFGRLTTACNIRIMPRFPAFLKPNTFGRILHCISIRIWTFAFNINWSLWWFMSSDHAYRCLNFLFIQTNLKVYLFFCTRSLNPLSLLHIFILHQANALVTLFILWKSLAPLCVPNWPVIRPLVGTFLSVPL